MDRKICGGNRRLIQVQQVGANGFTRDRQKRFLDTLAATCNVRIAAKGAGMALSSCYRLRSRDSQFADAWRLALSMGYERLEEALLDYALSKIEAVEIEPEDADPVAMEDSVVTALADRRVSNADLQFAVGLLNRHRAMVEGRGVSGRGAPRATMAETDAALREKLDSLERRTKSA